MKEEYPIVADFLKITPAGTHGSRHSNTTSRSIPVTQHPSWNQYFTAVLYAPLQVKSEYASVADFVKITVLERTSRVNGGEGERTLINA